jgi:hypothetical protein
LISNYTLVTKVVELIFMNTREPVLPFLDFSTISYEFSKLSEKEMEKVTDPLQTDPWKFLKQSNPVPGRLSSRGGSPATNSGEIARRRRGEREGKCSGAYKGLRGDRSWAGEEL